jgi:hypothetical protein
MNSLPELIIVPERHAASCASLSLFLLDFLHDALPLPPAATFSVGSGPGLLEALFLQRFPQRAVPGCFYGVEVSTSVGGRAVNRFLSEEYTAHVPGTWAVASGTDSVEGLLFVYPRQSQLVRRYIEEGAHVRTVVWIGPKCDVEDFATPLRQWGHEVDITARGLVEDGEAVMLFTRPSPASS